MMIIILVTSYLTILYVLSLKIIKKRLNKCITLTDDEEVLSALNDLIVIVDSK